MSMLQAAKAERGVLRRRWRDRCSMDYKDSRLALELPLRAGYRWDDAVRMIRITPRSPMSCRQALFHLAKNRHPSPASGWDRPATVSREAGLFLRSSHAVSGRRYRWFFHRREEVLRNRAVRKRVAW